MTIRVLVSALAVVASAAATAAAGGAPGQPSIPLRVGLTVVGAASDANGDYESIARVVAVTESEVILEVSADLPALAGLAELAELLGGASSEGREEAVRRVRGRRIVRQQDLREAREFMPYFAEEWPEVLPGTTSLGVSAVVFRDLKSRGESMVTMSEAGAAGLGATLGSLLQGAAGDLRDLPGLGQMSGLGRVSGTVKRVEPQPVSLPVLVNDQAVELPTIHARGTLGDNELELYLLDELENPLALRWAWGGDSVQIVKISFPGEGASPPLTALARRLETTGRAEVYGIHFDFASAAIKPESEGVLSEIASVLGEHPDWRLSVEGHTDAIGDEDYNLSLSVRRAEAVMEALVARYGIAAARLAAAGFGESRPRAGNETLEGRALNRRVELVRN